MTSDIGYKKMILYIDTTDREKVTIKLLEGKKVLVAKTFFAFRAQAEKLLPAIDKLLREIGSPLSDIKDIKINNHGGAFTSLRIGVTTANALAYSLGAAIRGTSGKPRHAGKISLLEPRYGREPDITVKNNRPGLINH